ncbi:CPBP family glutamic-type intramembrane protease [Sphingobacterium sp. UT-1RO-CII-1]|uniref:CPBP family glutamic-type intramembrane protease n=1 Tax=Sphingobacterium sp. UT-1RO-CII-1 TaxID=2995225 RepID=UPI00227CE777|nr:CPBP family glutamic-type intramembrane protease [Sphingobacterium sp. UT-1RO-CII-1]MCY4781215.1 CPBP family glutamic-type intramembrane protease [Sphingobacterium sp. UT-1RO-CII-1]
MFLEKSISGFYERYGLLGAFVLFFSIKILVTGFLSFLVSNYIGQEYLANPVQDNPTYATFFLVVILFPFIETLIFQYLVFYIGRKLNIKDYLTILLSTLFFALAHHYNVVYVVVTFFSGFIYAYAFFFLSKKANDLIAFLFISFLHILNNLLAFIPD